MTEPNLVVGAAVKLSDWAGPNHTAIDGSSLDLTKLTIAADKLVAGRIEVRNTGDIGFARWALFAGRRVRRAGWNGKGMHLELQVPDAHSKMTLPYVFMFTAQGDRVPWLCSQTDLLATDWELAE